MLPGACSVSKHLAAFIFFTFSSSAVLAQFPADTLLNITYESGTTNSGIAGVNPTNATAADAAYMVSPGATGSYAIAHKVVHGDTTYISNGSYRSESDADYAAMARFLPGDMRRYEFSVLLKDWTPWNTGDPADETNIFQLKLNGPNVVPLQIRTQRNVIRLRMPIESGAPTIVDILPDVQPYVNQWIHFRVDMSWTSTPTGFMKVYMKLPGQNDYVLKYEKTNYISYLGSGTGGQHGYVKWGAYIVPAGLTRIVYHDDIRIINLGQPPVAPGLIWGNSISDANPGFLDGPYTKARNVTNPASYSNASDVYLHPYIKYQAAQNIVYFNSTNPPPDPADNVVGTPWSDFSRATLSPGGSANGAPGPGGRYYLMDWANAPSVSTPSLLDTTEYYAFHLEPKNGYYINFDSINFTVYRGSSSATTFALRSSLDNFAADIAAPAVITGTASTPISFNVAALTYVNTPITFRLYPYGATTTSGTKLVGMNDFRFFGQVLSPSDFGDAPESYGTSGTGHNIGGAVYLGALSPDMDTSALYTMDALGDDNGGIDDEDGITAFPPIAGGTATNIASYTIPVTVHNTSGFPASLCGWIDWNGNNQFDASEAIAAILPDGATSATLSWTNVVLGGFGNSGTYARFRISTDTTNNKIPQGVVKDGEVEDYFIPFTTPLPIMLASFNVVRENTAAVLSWETSGGQNSDHFVVERSGGAGKWQEIGMVKASRIGSEQTRYHYTDDRPLNGINYYRLRIVDSDGHMKLSEVSMLTFNSGAERMLIVPNPAKSEALLIFDRTWHGSVTVKITDLYGKTQMTKLVSDAGYSCRLDLSRLAKGIYTVQVQGTGGSEQIKLVIQ